jgi:CDP-diacylglycerol--serine O-phosphatidyltransferase
MTGDEQRQNGDKKHFTMLRTFVMADFLTMGNAASGTVAIFMCLSYLDEGGLGRLWAAFALLPVALVLDILDGFVARKRRSHSVLGADLDSLADIISFGVAPAVIGFTLGLRGGWDIAILVYFVVCGLSRLARYNVTAVGLSDESGKVRHYEGTPIPTSLVLVAIMFAAALGGRILDDIWFGQIELLSFQLHPLSLMFLASGSAMISRTLRIPKP